MNLLKKITNLDVFFFSGSLGLTLTAASVVIMFEPNDTFVQEVQAIDRAHRIGQKLEVDVIKFYVERSVEGAVHDFYSDKAKFHDIAIAQNPHLLGNQESSEKLYDVDAMKCPLVTADDDFETINSKLVEVEFRDAKKKSSKQPRVARESSSLPREQRPVSEKDSVLVVRPRGAIEEVEDDDLKKAEMAGTEEGQPMVVYVEFLANDTKTVCIVCSPPKKSEKFVAIENVSEAVFTLQFLFFIIQFRRLWCKCLHIKSKSTRTYNQQIVDKAKKFLPDHKTICWELLQDIQKKIDWPIDGEFDQKTQVALSRKMEIAVERMEKVSCLEQIGRCV